MGNRVYFNQFLSDTYTHHQLSITDVHDIGTVKDYMKVHDIIWHHNTSYDIIIHHNTSYDIILYIQYAANLDETPAVHGGKENYWRRLELESEWIIIITIIIILYCIYYTFGTDLPRVEVCSVHSKYWSVSPVSTSSTGGLSNSSSSYLSTPVRSESV